MRKDSFFLPKSYCNGEIKYYTNCFCSPNCTMSYNYNIIGDENVFQRESIFKYSYKIQNPIKNAPHFSIINIYGGNLTPDEYINTYLK